MYIMYGANEEDAADIALSIKMANVDEPGENRLCAKVFKDALTIMGYAEAYPGFNEEYKDLNISDKIYSNMNIERTLFAFSTFTNCLFANCRIYLSEILSSNLQNCIFENCTFICTVFSDSNEMNVTFSNCKFIDSIVGVDYDKRVGYDPLLDMYYKRNCFDDPSHVKYNNCIHSYIVTEDPYVE